MVFNQVVKASVGLRRSILSSQRSSPISSPQLKHGDIASIMNFDNPYMIPLASQSIDKVRSVGEKTISTNSEGESFLGLTYLLSPSNRISLSDLPSRL